MRIFTEDEVKLILEKHSKWLQNTNGGERANLIGANLIGANLIGANLTRANLTRANLTRANLIGANLTRANLTRANLTRANLDGANLIGANLIGANLIGANLDGAREDFMNKLTIMKNEAAEFYKAILLGKINGTAYRGECACFVGTIANVKQCDYEKLEIKADSNSPIEKLFLAFKPGDIPENNPISKIVKGWCEELMNKEGIKIPVMKVVWE